MTKLSNIAILIMAAGTSSRMKAIKQLLPWEDSTFIGNALKNAQNSKASNVLTVLGAYTHEIKEVTDFSGTACVHNPNWKMGLGNSIAWGTKQLLEQDQGYDGILVMLTDQPLIDVPYLNTLIDTFSNSQHTIVATQYDNRVGVPAIFGKIHFEALLELNSDFGARDIIKTKLKDVLSISADGKELDIDTKEEYEKVRRGLDSGD
ncbi:nucleotidyltransferase family protein [Arenibacter sp. F20364]|uniref:nucleotidyltransferase family protein n=1 Tax=Arenibacter sp. F20364 TaxID=2926415 RepID=UPI001FF3E21B|nr:nucleotidyltransferase family protein [Arenibacter sp. F20364]MCK0191084.1 nucleotidyltransferase family protein [Arenibacter sp. F20364]